MNFCRQCGAPVGVLSDASEQPTSILNQSAANPATQRLDPRPTNAGYGVMPPAPTGAAFPVAAAYGVATVPPRSGSIRGVIIVCIIIVVLLGIGSVLGVMRSVLRARSQRRTSVTKQPVNNALVYPGAKTVVNVTSADGAGVLQLQTTDEVDKVADWYEANLKPTKTVRLGPMVILKNENVAATIVSDGSNTNITIKQTP
jgi:hypothetical protein